MPRKSKSINKPLFIPEKVKTIVENFPKNDKRKTVRLYKTIENLHRRDNVPLSYFDEIPIKYFKKQVRDYAKFIKILEDNGIIERTENYSFKNHQCYSYRILPDVLTEFSLDNISELPDEKFDILDSSKKQQIKMTLDRLKVDKDAAYDWIDCYTQELTLDDFTFNYKINFEYINLKLPGKTVRISRDRAIMDAMKQGKVIVNTVGQDTIMAEPEEFVGQKRRELEREYKLEIDMLKRGIYSISRSPVNYRVSHPLTNIKKNLLQFITIDGQKLVNVDISNSQLAILANILEGKVNYEPGWTFPDVTFTENDYKFIQMCKEGQIYEYIAEKIGYQTRDEAKKATFGMLFSHYGKMSAELIELKREFNGILTWIDQFKRLNNQINGEKHFSTLPIFLQRTESQLIIDELWDQIPQGVPHLSVHDSFLTTEKNSEIFQNLINQKLDCKVAA